MKFVVDDTLLLECLRNERLGTANSRIIINNFQERDDVAIIGSNFCSEVFKVCVEYEVDGDARKDELILKIPFLSSHYRQLQQLGMYDKELYVYDVILPKIHRLLDCSIAPKHYHSTESQILALEDMSVYGYRLQCREMLDVTETVHTLETLAKFHAASAKLYEHDVELLERAAKETIFSNGIVTGVMDACYPVLSEILHLEGVRQDTIRNFKSYYDEIRHKSVFHFSKRIPKFYVLNHADLKTNNILFKYDENGDAISAILLDYQTCRMNTPVMDIVFLFMASVPFYIIDQHGEQLIEGYLETLQSTLNRLNCRTSYTKKDYISDLNSIELFQIFTLIWTGFLGIRAEIKYFDYGENYKPLRCDEMEKIRRNDIFRQGFLAWFHYYKKCGFF